MYKIGVMGSKETVLGFKALGLSVFPVTGKEEAHKLLKTLTKPEEQYAILYIEENLAKDLTEEIDKFKDMPTPAVILIPGKDGSLGLGQRALKSAVERAVGSDIG